jgi:hypothetical protein
MLAQHLAARLASAETNPRMREVIPVVELWLDLGEIHGALHVASRQVWSDPHLWQRPGTPGADALGIDLESLTARIIALTPSSLLPSPMENQ